MTREDGRNQAEVSDLGRDVVGWGVAGDKRNQFFEELGEMFGEQSVEWVIFEGIMRADVACDSSYVVG